MKQTQREWLHAAPPICYYSSSTRLFADNASWHLAASPAARKLLIRIMPFRCPRWYTRWRCINLFHYRHNQRRGGLRTFTDLWFYFFPCKSNFWNSVTAAITIRYVHRDLQWFTEMTPLVNKLSDSVVSALFQKNVFVNWWTTEVTTYNLTCFRPMRTLVFTPKIYVFSKNICHMDGEYSAVCKPIPCCWIYSLN